MAATKRVKGVLFVDYVRMLKSHKGFDWSKYLLPEDMIFLKQPIQDHDWYSFETFERMGIAILKEIAKGNLDLVRIWGKLSIDGLVKVHPTLVVSDDPMESIMRFQVLRGSFFDFGAIYIDTVTPEYAKIEIQYGMSKIAEEAATLQAIGFFERLIELSGAKDIGYNIMTKAWEDDPATMVELFWSA